VDEPDLKADLQAAVAEAKPQKEPKPKKEKKERVNLYEQLVDRVRKAKLTTEDKTRFLRVSGSAPKLAIYIAKTGYRVDLSGFSVRHPAVISISEEKAKVLHLGKVRGQVDFKKTADEVMAAFDLILAELAKEPLKVEPKIVTPKS
jgi:hypothetical protein